MNNYMKKRWEQRRKQAIEKLGGKCTICGNSENLEFDHIDPSTKLYTIARASSFSEKRFWEEVSKCQLLCVVHHQNKTIKEKTKNITHGTISGYYHYRCRCLECKTACSKYKKQLKKIS